jgi:uncharacterized protein
MVAGAALALPAAAGAHVSVHPNAVPAGANVALDIRVPNEMDNATTTKLQVKFPDGFIGVSTQPPPGWTAKVQTSKLAKPVQTDDGPIDTQVSEVDWTASSGAGIKPGEFANFPISVAMPGKGGDVLSFKALQTYSNGQVVRWIEDTPKGGPEPENPAPVLTLTNATESAQPASSSSTSSTSSSGSDSTARTLGIIGIVVGAIGVVVAGLAMATSRRRASHTAANGGSGR